MRLIDAIRTPSGSIARSVSALSLGFVSLALACGNPPSSASAPPIVIVESNRFLEEVLITFPGFCTFGVDRPSASMADRLLVSSDCHDYIFESVFSGADCGLGCVDEVLINGVAVGPRGWLPTAGLDDAFELEIRGCGEPSRLSVNLSELVIADHPDVSITDVSRTETGLRYGWSSDASVEIPWGRIALTTSDDDGNFAACARDDTGVGELTTSGVRTDPGNSWAAMRVSPFQERRSEQADWQLIERLDSRKSAAGFFRPLNAAGVTGVSGAELWKVSGGWEPGSFGSDDRLAVDIEGQPDALELESLLISGDGAEIVLIGPAIELYISPSIDRFVYRDADATYRAALPHVAPLVPLRLTPVADERLELEWTNVTLANEGDASDTIELPRVRVETLLGVISRPTIE